jgi:hypothetical protein
MFGIDIFNRTSQKFSGLCDVYADYLSLDQVGQMVTILTQQVENVLETNRQVAVHDVLRQIEKIVGRVEMDQNLHMYGTSHFCNGYYDVRYENNQDFQDFQDVQDVHTSFFRPHHSLPQLWEEFRFTEGSTIEDLHRFLY